MNFISLRFSYKKGEIIRPLEAKCHPRLADPEGGRMFIERPYKPFTDPEGGRMSTISTYDHLPLD